MIKSSGLEFKHLKDVLGITYSLNAVECKLHNKRVSVGELGDGTFALEFKRIDKTEDRDKNCTAHLMFKEVLAVDVVRLSRESLETLLLCGMELLNEMSKRGEYVTPSSNSDTQVNPATDGSE